MSLVNYLGTYETLDQVWETYPEGGKEGDYLYIASVLKKWNKYTSAWVDATEEDVEGSTIMSLEEDVVVGSSTLINYLGRFETLENAINTYPEGGNEGDYIYVGDDIYAWDKYANGWFVSSDTPLEVAISEEDIIPDSNTFVNYLGGFVDRDAVWHKYPEGGKVGDYLYIASDLHIWDKYICNWVAATPPDESSQIRPIEHLSQEGVVEYSENYINYLGVFESIEQAWEVYPEGGKEGDYIIVGGEQLRWNKYTSNWGEYDPDASTPARPVATIYGDLHVHNDVIIGEDLYARILETFTTKKWVLEQGYISLDDVTSELVMSKIVPDNTTIEVRGGKLVVIGGGGGGVADSVAWSNVTNKPTWITDTQPKYSYSEILDTPDLSVYAIKSSVDNALSGKADKATTLAGYGITNAYTKSEVNNIIDSLDDTYVTIAGEEQSITAEHNFVNGFKVGGLPIKKSQDKTLYLDANLVVSGAITMYGSDSTTFPTIWASIPFDSTMKWDGSKWSVVGSSGSGSGLDLVQLEEYLTTNGYATQSWVSGKGYLTGITGTMVTTALGYTPVAVNTGLTSADNNAIGYGYVDGGWPEAGSAMVFGAGNYKAGVQVGAFGSAIRYGYTAGATSFTWRTILDENNYSDYALPIAGGTLNGALWLASGNYIKNRATLILNSNSAPADIIFKNNSITTGNYGYWAISSRSGEDGRFSIFRGNENSGNSSEGELFVINANGTFVLGGSASIYGNLVSTGAITMYYSSDKRLKQNIRQINASEVLMSLGGVYQYEYIDSEVQKNSTYGGSHFGLIYQNVKGTALDKMCHKREDGMGALNYLDTNFISLIAGATMEHCTEIEKLKKENKALRKEVELLKQQVA